jgi:hypothetical protein
MLFQIDHTTASVTDFTVREVPFNVVAPFIEKWHYSHSAKGQSPKHCFALMHEGDMIGGMIYGFFAMRNQWKKYSVYGVDDEFEVIELRRLVCIDETPRNTESYFIGQTIKWLKKNTNYRIIVSYADPHHGHAGTIYKATNFYHVGMTSPGKIIDYNGQRYHDKCIRDINKAHLRKTGERIPAQSAVRLINALESGEARMVETPGKHIYVMPLNKKSKKLIVESLVN